MLATSGGTRQAVQALHACSYKHLRLSRPNDVTGMASPLARAYPKQLGGRVWLSPTLRQTCAETLHACRQVAGLTGSMRSKSRLAAALVLIIVWNRSTRLRASAKPGTPASTVATTTVEACKWLEEHLFIEWDTKKQVWAPTDLGTACAAAGMDPDDALSLKEVIRLLRCLLGDF